MAIFASSAVATPLRMKGRPANFLIAAIISQVTIAWKWRRVSVRLLGGNQRFIICRSRRL